MGARSIIVIAVLTQYPQDTQKYPGTDLGAPFFVAQTLWIQTLRPDNAHSIGATGQNPAFPPEARWLRHNAGAMREPEAGTERQRGQVTLETEKKMSCKPE